jgi:Sec-independent protein translocase protein TatA
VLCVHFGPQQLSILLLIALLILANRRLRELSGLADALARELREATQRHLPVYSAETTRGNEAEFIRDRLSKRFPTTLVIALFVSYAAAAWWLTR